MRYKLTIAYRGTRYHGWQKQAALPTYKGEVLDGDGGIPTIQEIVRRAIAKVVRHPINLVGSSRTDAGVHAKGQVAHFDTEHTQIPAEHIRRAANHQLPDDILIRSVEPVSDSFDAILSTVSKRYQYYIWNALDRPMFFGELVYHRWQPLDTRAMAEVGKVFEGEHDFASFARAGHGRENTIRTVHAVDVSVRGPRIVIGIEGSGFLWQQIRIMVGTLVEVGMKRYGAERVMQMLAAKDRKAGGPTAPPMGLFLQWIRTRDEGDRIEGLSDADPAQAE